MIVPEIMTGSVRAALLENAHRWRTSAALAFSVSKIVSTIKISAPPSIKRCRRLGIGRAQIVEAHRAKARIIDVGRNRGGAIGRPQRAGDEAATAVLLFGRVRGFAGEPRRGEIQFGDKRFHPIIGLRDPRRTECIRLDDVGAGFKIGEMNGL